MTEKFDPDLVRITTPADFVEQAQVAATKRTETLTTIDAIRDQARTRRTNNY